MDFKRRKITKFKTLMIDKEGRRIVIDSAGRSQRLKPADYYVISRTGYSYGIGTGELVDFFLCKLEVETE